MSHRTKIEAILRCWGEIEELSTLQDHHPSSTDLVAMFAHLCELIAEAESADPDPTDVYPLLMGYAQGIMNSIMSGDTVGLLLSTKNFTLSVIELREIDGVTPY